MFSSYNFPFGAKGMPFARFEPFLLLLVLQNVHETLYKYQKVL